MSVARPDRKCVRCKKRQPLDQYEGRRARCRTCFAKQMARERELAEAAYRHCENCRQLLPADAFGRSKKCVPCREKVAARKAEAKPRQATERRDAERAQAQAERAYRNAAPGPCRGTFNFDPFGWYYAEAEASGCPMKVVAVFGLAAAAIAERDNDSNASESRLWSEIAPEARWLSDKLRRLEGAAR